MSTNKETEAIHLVWERFQSLKIKERIPHALLLTGNLSKIILDLAYQMAAAILCAAAMTVCNECKSCRLIHLREHPDVHYLTADKEGGIIKIEQIRELQPLVYTSAQLSNGRVIILHPAEKMNTAAANALLKVLEEPPAGVYFILIAQQISTLPATITSRCQHWRVSPSDCIESDYLTAGEQDGFATDKSIFNELPTILEDLMQCMANQLTVCTIAERWSKHDFSSLIRLLYLINAQLIDYKINAYPIEKNWTHSLTKLAQYFDVVHLFKQLEQITEILKKLQHNVNFNQSLVLENLLLGYRGLKSNSTKTYTKEF